jgi:type VI secretion system protein ImpF
VAELSLQERLQPSLLDRLTDNEPDSQVEARAQRVLSINRLKRSVLRDLAWLLNSGNLAEIEDLSEFPAVTNSVINYGVAGVAGTSATSADIPLLERRVRQAIIDFEPRILPKGLSVKVVLDDERLSQKMLTFQIEGQLWAQPLPVNLYLRTDVDLETGSTTVSESSG